MRSKLQAIMTPQATALARAATSLESLPVKKKGTVPNPAAQAIRSVISRTVPEEMFMAISAVEEGFRPL